LRRLAKDLSVGERVRFVTDVDEEGLLGLYAGARLVLVTPADEDLGYVPLEAFLSGKAVLTTDDAGGPLEFVRDGETGFVVPASAEALGAALRLAWEKPDALAALGENGRRSVAGLTWDSTVSALLSAAGLSR
jgi:glycosyltransferase involved in cell wall biosynthesis